MIDKNFHLLIAVGPMPFSYNSNSAGRLVRAVHKTLKSRARGSPALATVVLEWRSEGVEEGCGVSTSFKFTNSNEGRYAVLSRWWGECAAETLELEDEDC